LWILEGRHGSAAKQSRCRHFAAWTNGHALVPTRYGGVGVNAELMTMEKVNRMGGFSDLSSDPDVY